MESGGYNEQPMSDFDEQIDWEHVGNPPPARKFNVECETIEHRMSKNSNKHMLSTKWKIIGFDPEFPEDEKFIGRTLFCYLNFSQQGAFLAKQLLTVLNIDLPRMLNKAVLEDLGAQLLGQQAGAQLKHRTWQDQQQAEISKFIAVLDTGNSVSEHEVEDTTGGDDASSTETEEEPLEADADAPEEEPEAPPPPPVRRSLREAAAAQPAKGAQARPKTNGTHGATNGHTNGTSQQRRLAPAPAAPAKKAVAKPQARR